MGQLPSRHQPGDGASSADECCAGGCIPLLFPLFRTTRQRGLVVDDVHEPQEHLDDSSVAHPPGRSHITFSSEGVVFEQKAPQQQQQQVVVEGTTITTATAIKLQRSPPPVPPQLLSQLVAVDCGLASCMGNERAQLRRVCIVDGTGSPLLNETVKVQPNKYKKYQTDLARAVSARLPRINECGDELSQGIDCKEVQRRAAALIAGKIVVGHSVAFDLKALGLKQHPPQMVRDTATYGPFRKPNGQSEKLSVLVKSRLRRDIQHPGKFHCCLEDARAALDLYKSVWVDFERSIGNNNNNNNNWPVTAPRATASSSTPSDRASRMADDNTQSLLQHGKPNVPESALPISPQLTKADKKERKKARRKLQRKQEHQQMPQQQGKDALEVRRKKRREKKQRKLRKEKPLQIRSSAREKTFTFLSKFFICVFFIIRFPFKLIQDIIGLTMDVAVLTLRKVKLRMGLLTPVPKRKNVSKFYKFMLLSHALIELLLTAIVFPWVRTSQAAESSPPFHWAAASAMLGVSLLVRKRRPDRQSRICLGILAYYHLGLLLMSLEDNSSILDNLQEYLKVAWDKILMSAWADGGCYLARRSLMPPYHNGETLQSTFDFAQVSLLVYHAMYCSWFTVATFS